MKQLPGFNLWIFRGSEVVRTNIRDLDPNAYYVGHKAGAAIESGPYTTEAQALADARAMTDTSGT